MFAEAKILKARKQCKSWSDCLRNRYLTWSWWCKDLVARVSLFAEADGAPALWTYFLRSALVDHASAASSRNRRQNPISHKRPISKEEWHQGIDDAHLNRHCTLPCNFLPHNPHVCALAATNNLVFASSYHAAGVHWTDGDNVNFHVYSCGNADACDHRKKEDQGIIRYIAVLDYFVMQFNGCYQSKIDYFE